MKSFLAAAFVVLSLAVTAAPAAADHNSGGKSDPGLELEMKFGEHGFRLGARVFGFDRAWSGWVWGDLDRSGPRLDGRFEGDGAPLDFTLDAGSMRDWMRLFMLMRRP